LEKHSGKGGGVGHLKGTPYGSECPQLRGGGFFCGGGTKQKGAQYTGKERWPAKKEKIGSSRRKTRNGYLLTAQGTWALGGKQPDCRKRENKVRDSNTVRLLGPGYTSRSQTKKGKRKKHVKKENKKVKRKSGPIPQKPSCVGMTGSCRGGFGEQSKNI